MAFKGEEKEKKNYSKYVGLMIANIVAVNPTKTELEKLLNTTIDKDPEYTGFNDTSGAKKLTLSFWLRDIKKNNLFNVRFNMEDTIVVSKSGKTQYINTIGTTSYAEEVSKLPDFVTENGRKVRSAKKGEDLLYKLLRAWLNDLDFSNPSTELLVDDWSKLINGKTDELRSAISNFENKTVGALATIRTADDGKEYQSVYSYEFLPTFAVESYIEKGKAYASMNKFIERVNDAEYGCKDYYEITALRDYDPSKNVINTTNTPMVAPPKEKQSKSSFAPKRTEVKNDELEPADINDDLPF